MSEMVRNYGVIKELFPELETMKEKVEALAKQLNLPIEEVASDWGDFWDFKDYNNYTSIKGRLFDTSDAQDEWDWEMEHLDTVTKVGEGEYHLDLYYYNGGTCMEEIVEEFLEKEDDKPVGKTTSYYAIKRERGDFMTGDGGMPRMYLSAENAERAVQKHWPGVRETNYKIVEFKEQI